MVFSCRDKGFYGVFFSIREIFLCNRKKSVKITNERLSYFISKGTKNEHESN